MTRTELHPAHRPICKGLAELGNPIVVGLLEVRLVDRHRIVTCLTRAAHARFRQRSLHRSSGRGWRRRTAPRRCSVQGSHSRSARRSEPRPARRRLEPERARPEARATQAAVGSPAFARKGTTSTLMPLTARVSAKAPTGALAQASATAPKTPREARRITSNADIGTSGCVPGARRAESPRRLCLPAWHRFGRLQQAGCYFRLARKFSQSIWS
jgi:hypothetical protein